MSTVRSASSPSSFCLAVVASMAALPAWSAGLTLRAADAPVNTPWTEPAGLAVTREGGNNTVTVDLVLSCRSEVQVRRNANFARNGSYSAGVYLHRDTTPTAPKNDRGVSMRCAGLLIPDFGNARAGWQPWILS